jgi:hypothetical protein
MSFPRRARQESAGASSANGACRLLEQTLSSLVADSFALQQLTALRKQLHGKDKKTSTELREQLIRIERVVAELEEKVQIFRDVVKEETKAVTEIETCAEQAKAKRTEFLETKERSTLHRQSNNQQHTSQKSIANNDEQDGFSDHRRLQVDDDRTDDFDPRHHFVKLDLVTQEEFMDVPKAMRSHISRALVNEAILDIERTFQEKQTQRIRNRRRHAMYKWKKNSDDNDDLTCTEQEMRQSCAFFRSGESSARGVLLILRHLHRLKQIPSKNGKILYFLP